METKCSACARPWLPSPHFLHVTASELPTSPCRPLTPSSRPCAGVRGPGAHIYYFCVGAAGAGWGSDSGLLGGGDSGLGKLQGGGVSRWVREEASAGPLPGTHGGPPWTQEGPLTFWHQGGLRTWGSCLMQTACPSSITHLPFPILPATPAPRRKPCCWMSASVKGLLHYF